MKTRLGRGSRLVLRLPDRRVSLRLQTEADVDLDAAWSVPVVGLLSAPGSVHGTVEIATEGGLVTAAARLSLGPDGLVLSRLAGEATPTQQRRGAVRAAMAFPLRGVVLNPGPRPELADVAFDAVTTDVSEAGIGFTAASSPVHRLPPASTVFIELGLPGLPAPAVLRLVAGGSTVLRGSFADIARADVERLVRLVFTEQRRLLAARSRRG